MERRVTVVERKNDFPREANKHGKPMHKTRTVGRESTDIGPPGTAVNKVTHGQTDTLMGISGRNGRSN